MSAGLLPEVLLAFAALLIPGFGLCLASRVSLDRSFFTALALAFGMGTAAIGLGALTLALTGAFAPASVGLWWVALVAVGWTFAIRGGALRRHADGWRSHLRTDPWSAGAAALTIAGIAVVRWSVPPVGNIAPTVLRYWADAIEIADAGRIPRQTLQWGILIPPTTSKMVLNGFNASASFLLGRDPIESSGVLLFVVTVGLVIVAIALLRELGIRRLAPVGAILLFANRVTGSTFTTDLNFDLAEDWGRLIAFSAVVAAAIAFTRSRSKESGDRAWFPGAIVAAALLGASAGTHLIPASVALAMVCALALASIAVWHGFVRFAVPGAAVVGAGLALGIAILAIPRGDLGFEGAGGSARYEALREQLGLPESFDPTWFIVTHDMEASSAPHPLTVGDVGEAFAYRTIGQRGPHRGSGADVVPGAVAAGAVVILALIIAAAILWAPGELRVAIVWAATLAVVLLAVGVAFAVRYDLYALEAFGDRRLFTYAMLPTVTILIAGAEWAIRSLGRDPGHVTAIAGLALVILTASIFVPRATSKKAEDRPELEHQLALLRWVGGHVPCQGRVLMNRRTLGTFESVAHRAAVLEGMGPHIRPAVLARAIEEIFAARAYFEDPAGGAGFLERRGVAAVIAAKPGNPFGGYPALHGVPVARLEQVGYLRAAYRNPAGTVYLVRGFERNPSLPAVSGRPGFAC